MFCGTELDEGTGQAVGQRESGTNGVRLLGAGLLESGVRLLDSRSGTGGIGLLAQECSRSRHLPETEDLTESSTSRAKG